MSADEEKTIAHDDNKPLPLDFDRQVPAAALQLFNAMTASTARAQDRVIEMEKKRADEAEAEVKRLSADLYAVSRLHKMLGDPKYARRLINMLEYGGDYDDI